MVRILQDKEWELSAFRFMLKEKNFYQKVKFESEEIEKEISAWLLEMKMYKNVDLSRFTELFHEWNEIIFPVTISEEKNTRTTIRVNVIDSENKKYNMYFFAEHYLKEDYYAIEKKDINKKEYREHSYIIEENNIILKSIYAGALNEDGEKQDRKCKIDYQLDSKTTIATTEKGNKKIEIIYHIKDMKIDNMIINYLLTIDENKYSKDVVQVIRDLIVILGDVKEIITVEGKIGLKTEKQTSLKNEKIYARICIEDGEVIDYSPRKIKI